MGHIQRRRFLGSPVAILGSGWLGGSAVHAAQTGAHAASTPPHGHVHTASLMTECAHRWLAALDPEQKAKATFPLDADERMNWHFARWPRIRNCWPARCSTPG